MMSPTPKLVALLVTSTLAAVFAAPASAVVIDDFSNSTFPPTVLTAPGVFMHSDAGVAGVAGGDRNTTLTATAATSMVNGVGFEISGGQAFYASGPSANGAVAFNYDGATLAADLGGALTDIVISFAAFDDAFNLGMDVTVTVTDGVNTADLTQTIVSSMNNFDLVFLLALFNNIGSVDLNNLTAIDILFEAGQGQDFILNGITGNLIPEPASIAVWGMIAAVVGAFAGVRRWRSRKAAA